VTSIEPPPLTPPPQRGAEADTASSLSLDEVWASIRKNWLLVLAITAAVGLAVTFYTFGQTKIYESTATVLFDPQAPRPLGDRVQGTIDNSYWSNKEYYKTQYWVIQSLRITSEAVRTLGLNKDASFLANVPAGTPLPPVQVQVEDAARVLQSRLTVEGIKDSRLALVKYADADARRAQRVASALVECYIQKNLDDMLDSTGTAGDWLHSQMDSLKHDVENSEMALHEYKQNKNILSLSMEDQVQMLRDEMRKLSGAITDARTNREQLAARLKELMKIDPDDPQELPATELIKSSNVQVLRDAYLSAQRGYEALRARGKGDEHPDVRAVIAQRDSARSAYVMEVKNIQGGLQRDLAELDRTTGGLKKLFGEAEEQALDLNLLEIEYRRLARSKDNSEKLYSLVMERSKESDLTRTLVFNNIRVAERPSLPRGPVSPNVPLNIAGGLAAGLVLGLAAALGREQLDRSVKTPGQLEQILGPSFLGLLPSFGEGDAPKSAYYGRRQRERSPPNGELNTPELVVHEHPASGIAEAARAIRTNILFMSPDTPYRSILVTSAGPAEGKTTVACCIAIAMAQAGRRVVLLDCDMRRPRLHKVFGHSKEKGITTALIDDSSIEDISLETVVPNLRMITTGPLPPNPAEIFHSEAFARFMAALKERYDCVVIDSPPVVPVTDAAILSTAVDGTVLVVRAFRTTKDLARRASRALRDVGGQMIGTVLNAVDLNRHEYGYKYYYYYKREGYASEGRSGSDDDDLPTAAA
jgi:succinoglycan biosynthesis transport protein ExoP